MKEGKTKIIEGESGEVTGLTLFDTWTDSARMEEYAQTGDPKYLTVDLADKMNLGDEVMKAVPGVTEGVIALANRKDDLSKAKHEQEENTTLSRHGVAIEIFEQLPLVEQLKQLLSSVR